MPIIKPHEEIPAHKPVFINPFISKMKLQIRIAYLRKRQKSFRWKLKQLFYKLFN